MTRIRNTSFRREKKTQILSKRYITLENKRWEKILEKKSNRSIMNSTLIIIYILHIIRREMFDGPLHSTPRLPIFIRRGPYCVKMSACEPACCDTWRWCSASWTCAETPLPYFAWPLAPVSRQKCQEFFYRGIFWIFIVKNCKKYWKLWHLWR